MNLFNDQEISEARIEKIQDSPEFMETYKALVQKKAPEKDFIPWLLKNKDSLVEEATFSVMPVEESDIELLQAKVFETEAYLKTEESRRDFFRDKKERELFENRIRLANQKKKFNAQKTRELLEPAHAEHVARMDGLKELKAMQAELKEMREEPRTDLNKFDKLSKEVLQKRLAFQKRFPATRLP